MKKAVFVLAAVAVVAAAGLLVLAADADRYRPAVETKLSEALGRPVRIGRIALGWKGGLTGVAKQVTVGDPAAPDASADSIDAVLELLPLFSKKIAVKRLFVTRPRLKLGRGADGAFLLGSRPAVPGRPSDRNGQSGREEGTPLRVDLLKIEGGELLWKDSSKSPEREIMLGDVDVLVKRFDPARGFDAEGSFTVFSARVRFSVSAGLAGPAGVVRRLEAEADLASTDLDALYRAAPELRRAGLRGAPSGAVTIAAADVPFEGFPGSAKGEFVLKDGKIAVRSLPAALERVDLKASFDGPDAALRAFSASYAGAALAAEGRLEGYMSADPGWTGRASVRDLPLDAVLPRRPQGAPSLEGLASIDFEGSARGTAWPRLSRTLGGRGRATLEKAAVLNLNAARDVLQNLRRVPGIGDSVAAAVSPAMSARLAEPHTPLAPFATDFEARNGALLVPGAQVDASDFTLLVSGSVGLAGGMLDLRTRFFLSAELTATAARLVPELGALADANGRIEVPMRVSGTAARPSFAADVQSIVAGVAAGRGQAILAELLKKKRDEGNAPVPDTEPDAPSYEQILKSFF